MITLFVVLLILVVAIIIGAIIGGLVSIAPVLLLIFLLPLIDVAVIAFIRRVRKNKE